MQRAPDLPPLVFLGPSAPASDVHDLLPDAEIRPPVRRGDLHLARLMRYSVFVIIDGVFAQDQAVSPREVVDVVADGAAVVGAASMGALRAADCAPAGAEGVGTVYRLYRSGAIGSEDEVAVLYTPERPHPAATEALVSMRVALRRAVRRGALPRAEAACLVAAAAGLHYTRRTWRRAFAAAGLESRLSDLAPLLAAEDVKRADARAALARVAARGPEWRIRPRRSNGTFGLLSEGRERSPDPLLGATPEAAAPGFLLWMLGSGRANRYLPEGTAIDAIATLGLRADAIGDDPEGLRALSDRLHAALVASGEHDAEHYRHAAVTRAAGAAPSPSPLDLRHAEAELAVEHGATDWPRLQNSVSGHTLAVLLASRDLWSRAKALRRKQSDERSSA